MQDTILQGGYQLESILAADETGATFKVRVLGDSAANAFAKLFAASESDAQERVAVWQSARQLKNRYLAVPLSAGQTQAEGAALAYVVLRRPDETLDAAVRERALSREEAGEVLLALIRGLDELHSHGFVHGCVSPQQIVAIGDSIKLSTECIRRIGLAPAPGLPASRYKAPESGSANITAESDVWCIGPTLIEILTQQRCGEDCMERAGNLPAPFDTIARRCLDADPAARVKLGEMEALFRGRVSPPIEASKPAVPRPPAPAVPAAASLGRSPSVKRRPAPEIHEPKLRAWWLYVVAGIVVVLVLIWLLRPRHTAVAIGPRAAATSGTTPAQGSARESKTILPDEANTASPPQPAAENHAPVAGQSDFRKGPVWRVVLYTYARQEEADGKTRSINAKYPGLNAETFSPSGGSPYLVVVGGKMNRDDAARLRQKVRSLGLPRDSYIQNYQQ